MLRSLTSPLLAIALLVGGASGAKAAVIDPATVQWTYNFTPTMTPPAIFADGSTTASVSFTNDTDKQAKGSSKIVATNLTVNTPAGSTQAYSLANSPQYGFTLRLTLLDPNNNQNYTSTLVFKGKLTGTFSSDNAVIDNVFVDAGPKVATLGNYVFSVKMTEFTSPGPKSSGLFGSIGAFVTMGVRPTGGPIPQDTPEPTSLALCGLGLAFGGAAWWKRRRSQTPAIA